MTRKTIPALLGAALLTLGVTACTPDKSTEPENTDGLGETVVTETLTKTQTATSTVTSAPTTSGYPSGDVSSEYTADEIEFMRAACALYDDGNSAVDVLVESFDMPETTPLKQDPGRIGELIITSIPQYCPRHFDEIEKFNNGWA